MDTYPIRKNRDFPPYLEIRPRIPLSEHTPLWTLEQTYSCIKIVSIKAILTAAQVWRRGVTVIRCQASVFTPPLTFRSAVLGDQFRIAGPPMKLVWSTALMNSQDAESQLCF